MSESINIGKFSEALNDKQDRNQRNTDTISGADAIIEFQRPTAENNYTWYRKYASGWVEQGGYITRGSAATSSVTFAITMADTSYFPNATGDWNANTAQACSINRDTLTTTGMTVYKDGTGMGAWWEVKGMSA